MLIRFDYVRLANNSNLFSNSFLNFALAYVNMVPYIIQLVYYILTHLGQQSLLLHYLVLSSTNNLQTHRSLLPPFFFSSYVQRQRRWGRLNSTKTSQLQSVGGEGHCFLHQERDTAQVSRGTRDGTKANPTFGSKVSIS